MTTQCQSYLEDKPIVWTSFYAPVDMMKQIVRCVYDASQYGDHTTRRDADVLQKNIFYDSTTSIDLLLELVKKYQPHHNHAK